MSGEESAWSLRRRTSMRFAIAATAFLAVVALLVALGFRWFSARQLDEELREQVAMLLETYGRSERGEAAFLRAAGPTASESVETPMAWRADAGDETWGPVGPERLAEWVGEGGEGSPRSSVERLTRDLRRLRFEIEPGVWARAVLDGSDWTARARAVDVALAVIVVVGSLLGVLVGRRFGRSIAAEIESIARAVERREAGHFAAAHAGAPSEIRGVVASIESRLRETREEIERSRLLAAGLAHDLRAPIQSLLTSTQVALLTPPDSTKDLLERHQSELRNLVRTVDNLVAWGAPRTETASEVVQPTDLGDLLESRLVAEEQTASERRVFVDVERSGDLRIAIDAEAMVLAARNLVGNAIAWSPEHGHVRVRLSGRPGGVSLSVEDEGPGVPHEDRDRIFEPFTRGPSAPGGRVGYGLGLAIVASVARRHGGSVGVQEAPGGGAKFVLELPRRG